MARDRGNPRLVQGRDARRLGVFAERMGPTSGTSKLLIGSPTFSSTHSGLSAAARVWSSHAWRVPLLNVGFPLLERIFW